jgi:hypothetical protein
MKITRQVILDLLPLYLANEVSADTRALIEEYLETDPKLAKIAKQALTRDMLEDIPVPHTRDRELEAYRKAKQYIALRTIIIAIAIAAVLMLILWMFFSSSSAPTMSIFMPTKIAFSTISQEGTIEGWRHCHEIKCNLCVNEGSHYMRDPSGVFAIRMGAT